MPMTMTDSHSPLSRRHAAGAALWQHSLTGWEREDSSSAAAAVLLRRSTSARSTWRISAESISYMDMSVSHVVHVHVFALM
jgi:hypothetical protein